MLKFRDHISFTHPGFLSLVAMILLLDPSQSLGTVVCLGSSCPQV